jgi:hypothetical protein
MVLKLEANLINVRSVVFIFANDSIFRLVMSFLFSIVLYFATFPVKANLPFSRVAWQSLYFFTPILSVKFGFSELQIVATSYHLTISLLLFGKV